MAIPKQITFEGNKYNLGNKDRVSAATAQQYPDANGIQRITAAAATVIDGTTTLVDLAVDGAFNITMPAAEAGRKIRFFWSVEQATGHRDIGRAGSDTFAGNLNYTIEASGDSTMDSIPVANTIQTITVKDDVNIGSYIDFHCASDGLWLVSGHSVLDSIGEVATLA